MKRIQSFIYIAVLAGVFTACDDTSGILERTSEDGFEISINREVPVYEQVCRVEQRFGPNPRYCGYETRCTYRTEYRWVIRPDGSRVRVPYKRRVCYQQARSCFYPQRVCRNELKYTAPVAFNFIFDPEAKLLPGEVEEIEVFASGLYNRKRIQVRAKSSRYIYNPVDFSFDIGDGYKGEIRLDVREISRSKPDNNLQIRSARYLDRDTFELIFEDPYADSDLIESSSLSLLIKPTGLFSKNLIRGKVPLEDVEMNDDGSYRLLIRKDTPTWKNRPKLSGSQKIYLEYKIQRESLYFTREFSESKSTRWEQ